MLHKTGWVTALVAASSAVVSAANDDAAKQAEADWSEEPLDYANATSQVVEVAGYDYRESYPGKPMKGWTMSYAVATRQINATRAWTDSALSFLPPDELSDYDTDESWATCGAHIYLDSTTRVYPDKIDTSCKGVLSDACQKALRGRVDKSKICFSADPIPKECAEDFADAEIDDIDVEGTYASIMFADQLFHEPGNFTLYDKLVKRVVVSVIGYKQNPNEPVKGASVPKGPALEGILTCLRAENFKEGSRTRSGDVAGSDGDDDKQDKGEGDKQDKEEDDKQDKGEDNKQDKGEDDKQDKDQDEQGASGNGNGDSNPEGAASTLSRASTGVVALVAALVMASLV